MKQNLFIFLTLILLLTSCTKTEENSASIDDNANYQQKASFVTDQNFIQLVSNYDNLLDGAYQNLRVLPETTEIDEEVLLNILEFENKEEFRDYQILQQHYYGELIQDHNIVTKGELEELSGEISLAVSNNLVAKYSSSCAGGMANCMVNVLIGYVDYLQNNTGIGCSWSEGSACMNALNDFYYTSVGQMHGCVFNYMICASGFGN